MMTDRKAEIHVVLEHGVLSYVANLNNAEAIGLLECVKASIVRQALGGGPGAPKEPGAPASGGVRAAGLQVRRVDSGG